MPKAFLLYSNLDNLSDGMLADEHGGLCVEIAELEARKKTVAAELLKRGVSAEGERFRATIVDESLRETLDRAALEKAFGEATIRQYLKISITKAHVRTAALLSAAA